MKNFIASAVSLFIFTVSTAIFYSDESNRWFDRFVAFVIISSFGFFAYFLIKGIKKKKK